MYNKVLTLASDRGNFSQPQQLKRAFTLAEVLITLGIIGVIAALTLPTLISKYNKTVVETRLKKFYLTVNQAVRLSEIDNGNSKNWKLVYDRNEMDIEDWYNLYMKNYLKSVKTERNFKDDILVYFADGSMVRIQKDSFDWKFYPNSWDYKRCLTEIGLDIVDCSGHKYFNFHFDFKDIEPPYSNQYPVERTVEPYKFYWDGEQSSLYNDTDYGCKEFSPASGRAYCPALIQMNGWKIPDDYPIKF